MEYIPLTRLTASLSDSHSVANMAADVCHTLCTLHQNNEFHGDVKPQTIFRNESGLFCLTEPAGAPNAAFCPPEAPDAWGLDADTYALGRIMHWLLNGRQLAAQPLPNPRYADTVLTAIIMKACAADPRYRYQNAMDMLSDLEGYLSHKRKSVLPWVLGGILSAVLVVGIVAAIWLLSKPAEPTPTLPPQPVHSHSWSDATCIAPETCEGCGEERGEPLGHDWIPGDCETPDTCHRCGATSGESSGHVWLEATFELLIPLVVAAIVDTGIADADQPYITKMCIVMVVLGIIGLLFGVLIAASSKLFSANEEEKNESPANRPSCTDCNGCSSADCSASDVMGVSVDEVTDKFRT